MMNRTKMRRNVLAIRMSRILIMLFDNGSASQRPKFESLNSESPRLPPRLVAAVRLMREAKAIPRPRNARSTAHMAQNGVITPSLARFSPPISPAQ